MKFCVAQNFSVGGVDYNQNNAYCFTCPLTAEGKRQNLTLTLGKEGELHGAPTERRATPTIRFPPQIC